jgi:hypothetical protein
MMKSPGSVGEAITEFSLGVGGIELVAAAGVGRDGQLEGGAIGSVRESLLAFLAAREVARDLPAVASSSSLDAEEGRGVKGAGFDAALSAGSTDSGS